MPTAAVQTGEQVQALFDRIAPHYDGLNQTLSLGLHHVWKAMAVGWVDPPRGGQVLDVCCGSGDLAFHLARRVGVTGSVTGLDFSAQLLALAAQRGSLRHPLHHFNWIPGDALALPFEEDSFDGATMGYGLRNVTDIPLALRELWRVLRTGSRVAILDFHRPEVPVLRAFQAFYLQNLVVPLAAQLGAKEDYTYILPSLEGFPTGSQQVSLAQDAGFKSCQFFPLLGGLMGILVAQKQGS